MLNTFTPDTGYRLATNIVFDADNQLRLDVYTPDTARNAPVVIFFFGEGDRWTQGIKEDYQFVGQALAARGFVVVIPNYRLYPTVHFPAFLYDCANAVRWAHEHVAAYGGDPSKLVVMGHGAGAYNAAMLALDPELLHHVGAERNWLRGMIGLAGPYDFLPIVDPDLRDLFGPPERFDQTQPTNYIDGRNPPMLLMSGDDDQVISVQNTKTLADRVAHAGGSAETVLYPKMSHRWILLVLSSTLGSKADVVDHIAQFVTQSTTGPPPAPSGGPQGIAAPVPVDNSRPTALPSATPAPSSSAPLYSPSPAGAPPSLSPSGSAPVAPAPDGPPTDLPPPSPPADNPAPTSPGAPQ